MKTTHIIFIPIASTRRDIFFDSLESVQLTKAICLVLFPKIKRNSLIVPLSLTQNRQDVVLTG